MSRAPEVDGEIPIDRRQFLRVGGLGAAMLASGAAGCAGGVHSSEVAPDRRPVADDSS